MSFLDRLRAPSPARQIVVIAVAGVLLAVALTAFYLLAVRKPYGVLFTDLRAADAATIVADLDKRKTPYRLENGGATILVPKDQVDAVRLNEAGADLPLKGTVGFELFNKSDMGLTEFAQRINYQRALQGELARTIMTMRSIDSARVHLSLAEATIFRDDRRPSKASVTLTPRPGATITAPTVRGIQKLVAAATPNLAAADVVVLDERGEAVSTESATPDYPPESLNKQAIEDHYAGRLRSALQQAYDGRFLVTVTADLSPQATAAEDLDTQAQAQGGALRARAFPLSVVVVLEATPSPELQRRIRDAAKSALDLSPSRGDVITLATNAAAWTGPVAATPTAGVAPSPAATPARRVSAPSKFWLSWLLPILVLLLLLAGYLQFRGPPSRHLSAERRSRIAGRLRALLDEERARGPSTL